MFPPKTPAAFMVLLLLIMLVSWVWIYVAGRLVSAAWAKSWLEMFGVNASKRGKQKKEKQNEER